MLNPLFSLKTLAWLPLMVLSAQASDACPNLSGTYRFNGFDGHGCRQFRAHSMLLSPIQLGSSVTPGDTIEIRQNGCSEVTLSYLDKRYSNQPEIRQVITVGDGKMADWKKGRLVSRQRDSGTVCYFGCLSSVDTTSWSLGTHESGDLDFKFRSSMVGVYNFVVPMVDVVTARCGLEKR